MSTKTTFKRIALVAVAALGLGVLSSVPASAARTMVAGTNNITSISVSTDAAPVAGDLGVSSLHTITWTSDSSTSLNINPSVILKTMPLSGMSSATTSSALSSASAITDAASGTWRTFTATAVTSTNPTGHDVVIDTGTANIWPSSTSEELTLATANAAGNKTGKSYLHAHYAVAGTYVWTMWDDQNVDGIVNGTEFSMDYTVVVGSASTASVAVATTTAYNASTVTKVSTTSGNSGALVKLALKDAAGNAVAPGVGASVTVAVNGSAVIAKVNDAAAGAGTSQSYQLGAGDFDGSGNAYINVTNTVAEGVTLTTTGNGWGTFTPASNLGLTFTAVTTGSGTAFANLATPVGLKTLTAGSNYSYNYLGASIKIATNSTSSAVTDNINVEDTAGYLTGKAGADYDVLKAGAATTGGTQSFTMPAKTTSGVVALTLTINGGGSTTIRSAAASAYVVAVYSPTVAAQRAATATAVSMTVRVKDEFGGVVNGILVTGTISGRNSTVAIPSVATNASGIATLAYTDASTSTSSMRDVATLTVASATTSATVTTDFTADATLGVSTVLLTSNQTDADGATLTSYDNWQINAGDGAQGTLQTVTATVKDANGVALSGIPVVFTVAGSGVAIPSNKVTIYTDSTGTVAGKVYAWITGKYVVTATAGTKTDTVDTHFAQEDGATYVRTFTLAQTSDRVVTVTAKDRFGNLAKGASFTATLSGDNFFGTGTNVATGTTAADGTIKFVVGDSSAEVKMTVQAGGSASYGQTDALKGTVSTNDPLDVFTAATVGTAITAEVGVGASLDAAGKNSDSITLPASANAATAVSQAAADAAAEATDAANAATDAANAAAEAADAATAAAQDAADAVAALSAQVASLISGLKSQLTALTNLVIKIQKKVKA
jgi:hypothetical protein